MVEPFAIAAAHRDPQPPSWSLPSDSWDCHAHVFGPVARFPFPTNAPYLSPDQPAHDYLALLDAMGLRFGVLVQPSTYGADHGCMLDALTTHADRLVGVVDLDPVILTDAEAASLRDAGVVGVRLRWPHARGAGYLRSLCSRLLELAWHLDLLPADLAAMADFAAALPDATPALMVEAMGNPFAGQARDHLGFLALMRLLDERRAYVKISHSYHIDAGGPPYIAAEPFARHLAEAASDRCVWGSDWPHPMRSGQVPQDGLLLDLLRQWTGENAANRILTVNAHSFYAPQRIAP